LSGKRVEAEKTGGKPYVGMGDLSRLLAKRKAEETLRSVDADEDVEESPSKRDIGVSASWHLNQKPATAYYHGQPYGRIGRTRTTVRQTSLVPEPKRRNSRPRSRMTIA